MRGGVLSGDAEMVQVPRAEWEALMARVARVNRHEGRSGV
jgi:hypothetical protein